MKPEPRLFVAITLNSRQETFQFENYWQTKYFLEAARDKGLERGQFITGTSDEQSKDWKELKKFMETY